MRGHVSANVMRLRGRGGANCRCDCDACRPNTLGHIGLGQSQLGSTSLQQCIIISVSGPPPAFLPDTVIAFSAPLFTECFAPLESIVTCTISNRVLHPGWTARPYYTSPFFRGTDHEFRIALTCACHFLFHANAQASKTFIKSRLPRLTATRDNDTCHYGRCQYQWLRAEQIDVERHAASHTEFTNFSSKSS